MRCDEIATHIRETDAAGITYELFDVEGPNAWAAREA
jgi:hypothetical protein